VLAPQIIHALEIDQGLLAHTANGDGSQKFIRVNI